MLQSNRLHFIVSLIYAFILWLNGLFGMMISALLGSLDTLFKEAQ